MAPTPQEIIIQSGAIELNGILQVPESAIGIVIFAHGSGSSRFSARNQYVARELQKANFATLLFDLLTPEEESIDAVTAQLRFNIELLAERLISVTNWVVQNPTLKQLKICYFGASTGAAAALSAAAQCHTQIHAVVSRGGRPDLADQYLEKVTAPTLLIVGGNDGVVIELNEQAFAKLTGEKKLTIVEGATHLFEEKGKLEEVAVLARNWFTKYLSGS